MEWLLEEVKGKADSFATGYGKIAVMSLAVVSALVALCVIITASSPKTLRVSFMDVGQGDAVLISTPSGRHVLIDGGPSDIVMTRLADRIGYFDRNLDVIISTHGDSDHATGLVPVLKRYDADHLIVSPVEADTDLYRHLMDSMRSEGGAMRVGEAGDVLDFGDGVTMRVLFPLQILPPHTDTNDASVSVMVTYGSHSFLLTGDLSTKMEPRLIRASLPQHITVFKAGHHGSKTSSSEQLLSYITPQYAVISAGRNNRYGHPHEETLKRLSTYAKETLSTTDRGTITFESNGRGMTIVTEK